MVQFYPYRTRRKYRGPDQGVNSDHTWDVKCQAIGKAQNNESQYLIANEWISANLGQYLRLPVPPFSLMKKRSRKTVMFASYSFDGVSPQKKLKEREDVEALFAAKPDTCAGILAFDILIANCDRHGWNIKVDNLRKPTAVHLFDHERALFYIDKGLGVARLKSREDRLGVTDGKASLDEWHCLVEVVDSVELLAPWIKLIEDIPESFIERICQEVVQISITKKERDEVIAFLVKRRSELSKLIRDHRDRFTQIKNWPLFP